MAWSGTRSQPHLPGGRWRPAAELEGRGREQGVSRTLWPGRGIRETDPREGIVGVGTDRGHSRTACTSPQLGAGWPRPPDRGPKLAPGTSQAGCCPSRGLAWSQGPRARKDYRDGTPLDPRHSSLQEWLEGGRCHGDAPEPQDGALLAEPAPSPGRGSPSPNAARGWDALPAHAGRTR